MRRSLLISVAFNVRNYRETVYFQSREEWAQLNRLTHILISERTTGLRLDPHCAAWLRVPLMNRLRGMNLFYLDFDCVIGVTCRPPSVIIGGLDGLFVGRGHSGRPNSGVLIVSERGTCVFDFCLAHYRDEPPPECAAPWENGHMIWACTRHPWHPLPPTMNVTAGTVGDIIHHTGPNRSLRDIVYEPDAGLFDFSQETVEDERSLYSMADAILASSCFDQVRSDR